MLFFPLFDDNPTDRRPLVSWLIIGACVAVFLWQVSLPPGAARAAVLAFGMIPAVVFGDAAPPIQGALPAWLTVVSSMFLHGGWMHLIGNMVYLWIFGDNVEDSMGRGRFVLFYLVCGWVAAMTQAMIDPASRVPLIGASGGIAGVLGAYLVLHPRANVRVFMWFFIIIQTINVPAFLVLGVWIVMQLISVPQALSADGGVAYFAHIGGFVAGMALVPFFRRRDVPLFDAPRSRSWSHGGVTRDELRYTVAKDRAHHRPVPRIRNGGP